MTGEVQISQEIMTGGAIINYYTSPHITHSWAFAAMKRKNFEEIFLLIQSNTECRQQRTTSKLLHKYFRDKHWVLYFDPAIINNQIR